ncbi:hypothetical protein ACA910_019620 [Epithemia clementina (nom. ined.)]
MTCDALCSLGSVANNNTSNINIAHHTSSSAAAFESDEFDSISSSDKQRKHKGSSKACPKHLQLPMFLSKTYHMIDRCDPEIATWSESGDNFVVKNVEKFATTVLPLYFKHSNFSSFARQLNFYGFRKLRTDPILTNDVDPRTACYVRFFHEKFQKDKPELLHQIKRATKTDQQSKDDLDILKQEIQRLRDQNGVMKEDFDRRLAELSYECNRRVTALSADYDKLVSLVQPLVQQSLIRNETAAVAASLRDYPSAAAAASHRTQDLLHSLSAAALSQLRAAATTPNGVQVAQQQAMLNEAAAAAAASSSSKKRPIDELESQIAAASRARYE